MPGATDTTIPTYSPLARFGSAHFWALAGLGALVVLVGLGAAHHMETSGHVVTGMNNHVVWGLPHVFAVFLIVAASGALNVASIGSVFGKSVYKARAPLSGLLCIAMLAGGLMVLMLDLGRPDRLVVAATHYNFKSVFAWNVFLYSGMFGIVAVYLWMLMEKRFSPLSKPIGLLAFVWRLILTTGTGSIFGFLVARQAYQSAVIAPMFIVMSFAWGLAAFYIVQTAMYGWNALELDVATQRRLRNLLGVFVAGSLYFVAVYHLTNLYFARQDGFERFLLLDGGIYTRMFWLGYVLVGSVLPLALIYLRPFGGARATLVAAGATLLGALAFMYAFIIGGQAYPLDLFPGREVSSSFLDGAISPYTPSLPELLLGIGGVGAAFLVTIIGVRLFGFVPADDPTASTGTDD
ncbi:MAG: polysulfide reductase NrfD [Burkholderiaceae bacterium]|nr:polysulfide reductase NrfD [Burkholderiaceae bacterium]